MTEQGKRKRDDSYDREPVIKEKRTSNVRQECLEREFAETYHGLTALYKLLEVKHLQSPLLLPRTLIYRLDPSWQQKVSKKVKEEKNFKPKVRTVETSATLKDFKIAMTSDTMKRFKSLKQRPGILLSLYKAQARKFSDNQFTLLATCLIPVPCSKDVKLPKELLQLDDDMCIIVFQTVEVNDAIKTLDGLSALSFAAPAFSTTVNGKNLLSTCSNDCKPLFANLLRLNVCKRRTGIFAVELSAIESSMDGGVKCEFCMVWDALPKTNKLQRLANICDAKFKSRDVNNQIEESFALAAPKEDVIAKHKSCGGVWFHFLYHSMLRRMSEKRSEYSCAWCNMFAGSLRGLVAHLVSSHDRFRFQVTVGHDNMPHIYVMRVQEQLPNGSSTRRSAFTELEMVLCKEPNRLEHNFVHMSAKKYGMIGSESVKAIDGLVQDIDEIDELSEELPQDFYAPLLQRQFFHSRTGAVVLDHEKDYDSDDDVDETWITKQSERLLDEFEDVSLEEKEFMKKWNRHVKEFKILADFMVASSCRMFARKHGKWLLDHGLRHNFLLHLLNLWDNSLLNSRAIIDCMLIVDQNQLSEIKYEANLKSTPRSNMQETPASISH